MSISLIPTTVNTSFISKLLGNEKTRVVLISSVIYITVQITTILILGSLWGINGVAIAYVMSVVVQSVFLLIANRIVLEKTR